MENRSHTKSPHNTDGHIRFNAVGLAVFIVSLVIASGLLTASLLNRQTEPVAPPSKQVALSAPHAKPPGTIPAWGELITDDIDLEQPEEYVGFELAANKPPQWVFTGSTREQTRALLLACGLCTNLVGQELSNSMTTSTATIVRPTEQLLFDLKPAVRSKLYAMLARIPGNHYMEYPFCFPRESFRQWFGDGAKDSRLMAIVRKQLYRRGDGLCFSDVEFLMSKTTTDAERMEIVKLLSRQSAVLVRIHIRPDKDIEKLLGYW